MNWKQEKCVLVIDRDLPLGLAANTAAILGITLGKTLPEAVGPDVYDGGGCRHPGIVAFPVPILQGTAGTLRALRASLRSPAFSGLTAVDFSSLAQRCKTYEAFQETMKSTPEAALQYLGLALCGDKKLINKLTGSLPLLR